MWPLAELDHGLVEVIFSANGSRTSLLSARVRRQAHYSSILPLQASGIICHNWVWHDRTTECIKILLASPASSLAPACLQAGRMMDTSQVLTSAPRILNVNGPNRFCSPQGFRASSGSWVNSEGLRHGRLVPPNTPPKARGALEVGTLSHRGLKILRNHQQLRNIIYKLSYVVKNKSIVWKLIAKRSRNVEY